MLHGSEKRPGQSVVLSRWNPLFVDLPIEGLIFEYQPECYSALQESTRQTDVAPFVCFMLRKILQALETSTPQVTPQVQKLLATLAGPPYPSEMGRGALQAAIGLVDRKSFQSRYLAPAIGGCLIEMTIPNKTKSSLQKYWLTDKGRSLVAQGLI